VFPLFCKLIQRRNKPKKKKEENYSTGYVLLAKICQTFFSFLYSTLSLSIIYKYKCITAKNHYHLIFLNRIPRSSSARRQQRPPATILLSFIPPPALPPPAPSRQQRVFEQQSR
jgi:hypothetical protein